jgi:hypothetical protein
MSISELTLARNHTRATLKVARQVLHNLEVFRPTNESIPENVHLLAILKVVIAVFQDPVG